MEDLPDFASIRAVDTLGRQLGDPALKSSTRILILVLLALNRRLSCGELRKLTGLGKGSLENHLDRLELASYVTTSSTKFIGARGAPSQVVEITEKGLDECRALIKSINNLDL